MTHQLVAQLKDAPPPQFGLPKQSLLAQFVCQFKFDFSTAGLANLADALRKQNASVKVTQMLRELADALDDSEPDEDGGAALA